MQNLITVSWWALAIRGVAGILAGIAAIAWPGITLLVLVVLFAAYLLVDGIFALVGGARSRSWLLSVEGVLGIIAGVIGIWRPALAAVAILALFAAWAIVSGAVQLWGAMLLRRVVHNDWLLAVTGVLSIVFGILLIANPLIGLVALVWIFGIYALLTGILFLALAARLRGFGRTHVIAG